MATYTLSNYSGIKFVSPSYPSGVDINTVVFNGTIVWVKSISSPQIGTWYASTGYSNSPTHYIPITNPNPFAVTLAIGLSNLNSPTYVTVSANSQYDYAFTRSTSGTATYYFQFSAVGKTSSTVTSAKTFNTATKQLGTNVASITFPSVVTTGCTYSISAGMIGSYSFSYWSLAPSSAGSFGSTSSQTTTYKHSSSNSIYVAANKTATVPSGSSSIGILGVI